MNIFINRYFFFFLFFILFLPFCNNIDTSKDLVQKESIASREREEINTGNEDMALIPSGEFIMGSDKVSDKADKNSTGEKPWFLDEHPERKIYQKEYYIDIFEVTNQGYHSFDNSYTYKDNMDNFPVVNIAWFDADKYCKGRGKRLPNETEWEKAARGTEGREFPWGDKFDKNMANMEMTGTNHAVQVGGFKTDRSPFGVYDLAGNVSEWTESIYDAYPGNDYTNEKFGKGYRVVRGGSWGEGGHYTKSHYARSAYRLPVPPGMRFVSIGFRCVKD